MFLKRCIIVMIILFSCLIIVSVFTSCKKDEDTDFSEVNYSTVISPDFGVIEGMNFLFTVKPSSNSNRIFYTVNGMDAEELFKSNSNSEDLKLYQDAIFFENSKNKEDYTLTSNVLYSDTYFSYNFSYLSKGICISLIEVDNNNTIISKSRGTYVFAEKGKEYFGSIPVVCLSTSIENWIGSDKQSGVYNSYTNEKEKCRALLEYYDYSTDESFSLNTQIKLGGSSTRIYPCRTLNVNFKKDENGNKNEKPMVNIFPDKIASGTGLPILGNISRFRLHSGGNNCFTSFFTDALIQRLVSMSDTFVATAAYRPCILYLNGEYWGLYGLREHIDEDFIEYNYGVDSSDVIYVDKTNKPESGKNIFNFDIENGDVDLGKSLIKQLYEFLGYIELEDGTYMVENDKDWTSRDVYEEFCKYVDIDSFIDLILIEGYVGNWDFLGNNFRMWRTLPNPKKKRTKESKYSDGKWRFILHDLDHGLYNSAGQQGLSQESINSGKNVFDWYLGNCTNKYNEKLGPQDYLILSRFAQNKFFLSKMIERAEYIQNTVFDTEKAISVLDEMENEIEFFYEERFKRWGAGTTESFKMNHESHRIVLRQRPNYFMENIRTAFNIQEE